MAQDQYRYTCAPGGGCTPHSFFLAGRFAEKVSTEVQQMSCSLSVSCRTGMCVSFCSGFAGRGGAVRALRVILRPCWFGCHRAAPRTCCFFCSCVCTCACGTSFPSATGHGHQCVFISALEVKQCLLLVMYNVDLVAQTAVGGLTRMWLAGSACPSALRSCAG